MSSAYAGKIARVNLTNMEVKVEELDLELAKKFIGGRGLGTKILYDEGVAKVEPLSPENKLLFMPGPLTAAKVPTSGRYMVLLLLTLVVNGVPYLNVQDGMASLLKARLIH